MTQRPTPFPYYLAALLAIFVGFLVWSARQAATDGTRVTDRDYYAKGLRYNTTEIERRAASVLGWQVKTLLEQGGLIVELRDQQSQPLTNARIRLTTRGSVDQARILTLREIEDGRYRAEFPTDLSGEINAHIEIEHDGARLERNALISIPQ